MIAISPEHDTSDYGHELMAEGRVPKPLGPAFPAQRLLDIVAHKWVTVVLYCLSINEVRRFNELQRKIPNISKKMLVQTLRSLESDGLVERRVYPEVPPRTDYRLTKSGHRMREPIVLLCEWARDNEAFLDQIFASRSGQSSISTRKPSNG